MDLDELVREADPARGLDIDIPDPGPITSSPSSRRRDRLPSLVAGAIAVAAVLGVVLVALGVGSRDRQPAAKVPSRLPFGAPLHPPGPTGVLTGSARLEQVVADPAGGPAWGFRTYRTRSGQTCLQVGRTESGAVGAIGIDGAFGGDGLFHPFGFSDVGLGQCVPQDAHGHAFTNLDWVQAPAAATEEPCHAPGATGAGHCAASALREVYFGLLGPDATSVTYLDRDGHTATKPTRGPNGAYLIVLPERTASCRRSRRDRVSAPSMCLGSGTGVGTGASLTSGEITTVTYRNRRACHLPVPRDGFVRLGQCPVVGYAPPATPSYTEQMLATPVTVHKLPARYYCERPGIYRPNDLPLPCSGGVPAGYRRVQFTRPRPGAPGTEPGQNLLVYISWIARAPVTNTNVSSYDYSLVYPSGCGAGGESSGTQVRLHAGQRVTRSFYIGLRCRGTYAGEVTYVPVLGPQGENSPSLGAPAAGKGILLVGRFSFTVP